MDVTDRNHLSRDVGDRSALEEIEITAEMISAGADALLDCEIPYLSPGIAEIWARQVIERALKVRRKTAVT